MIQGGLIYEHLIGHLVNFMAFNWFWYARTGHSTDRRWPANGRPIRAKGVRVRIGRNADMDLHVRLSAGSANGLS